MPLGKTGAANFQLYAIPADTMSFHSLCIRRKLAASSGVRLVVDALRVVLSKFVFLRRLAVFLVSVVSFWESGESSAEWIVAVVLVDVLLLPGGLKRLTSFAETSVGS